jgi:hypothetical protein
MSRKSMNSEKALSGDIFLKPNHVNLLSRGIEFESTDAVMLLNLSN